MGLFYFFVSTVLRMTNARCAECCACASALSFCPIGISLGRLSQKAAEERSAISFPRMPTNIYLCQEAKVQIDSS
jgi:hypothetical protein